jgi:uncharacterized cupredoxin-like copper-binding protein
MTTANVGAAPVAAAHPPLSALETITAAALAVGAGTLVYAQAGLLQHFSADLAAFAALELGAAGLIALPALGRRRWAPILGTLFGLLTVAANSGAVIHDLTHPESFHPFAFMIVAVAAAFVMAAAGLAATVQNYRRPAGERRSPRGTAVALGAVLAFALGAVAVGALPREAGAGVSPEVLAELPALGTPGLHFDQPELHVKAGELVALRLENPHGAPHSFDVDELNVHVPMPAGKDALALFRPAEPGTYTFYCGVPGHREAGMVGTLIVEP